MFSYTATTSRRVAADQTDYTQFIFQIPTFAMQYCVLTASPYLQLVYLCLSGNYKRSFCLFVPAICPACIFQFYLMFYS